MKSYRTVYFISLCLLLVLVPEVASPSPIQVARAKNQDDKLNLFLAQAKLAYEKRSLTDFMQLVDGDYADRLDFQANLMQHFSSCQELTIIFSIDSAFKGIRQISVWLRWYRKSKDVTDRLNLENGAAQFLLIDRLQGYKLVQINGDNPFF